MTVPFVKDRAYGTGWFVKPGVKIRSIQSEEAFGVCVVARVQILNNVGNIPTGEGVGTPGVVYPQGITTTGIPSDEAFGGSATAPGAVNVGTTAIASGEAFGNATLTTGPVNMTVTGIASGEAVGTPTMSNLPNMMLDPTFEIGSPSYLQGSSDRTTEQARTGTYSFKLVSITTQTQLYFNRPPAGGGAQSYVDLAVGDLFYLEFYIKANASNVKSGLAITAAAAIYDSALANPMYPAFAFVYTTDINSTGWTKVTGLYRHTDATRTKGFFYLYTNPAVYADSGTGDSWYIDDVQLIKTQELSVSIPVDNEVVDYSAELGTAPASDGWAPNTVQYRSAEAARSGSYSMKLAPSTTTDANATFPMPGGAGSVVPTYPGEIWEIEFWYMAPVSNGANIASTPHFAIRNASTLVYSYPQMPAGGIVAPADGIWRRYTTTYTVPANIDRIRATVQAAISQNPKVMYLDDVSIRRLGVPAPVVEPAITPLSIPDDTQLATDPQVLRPELWKDVDVYSDQIWVADEDGAPAWKVTKTSAVGGGYPGINPIRDKNGNIATGAGERSGMASGYINISPGEKITLRCKVKPFPGNTNNANSRALVQTSFRDSTGTNAQTYPTAGTHWTPGIWGTIEITSVCPAGYDNVNAAVYMVNTAPTGEGFFVKDFEIIIEPYTQHAISVGPVNIAPGGIASAEIFGGSVTSPGAAFVSPTGIVSGEVFGNTAMAPSQPLTVQAITQDMVTADEGGFEYWAWWFNNIHSRMSLDTTFFHSGASSLKMVAPGGGVASRPIPVNPGEVYDIEFWYYGTADFNGLSGASKLRWGNATDASNTYIAAWGFASDNVYWVPETWIKVTANYTIPAGVTSIYLGIARDGNAGTIWLDDLRITLRDVGQTGVITTGPVNVAPVAIDDGASPFGTATISPGPVNVSPPGLDDGNIVPTPTFTVGNVDVAPTGIASAEAFGTQSITVDVVFLQPTGFDDASSTGNPDLSVGPVDTAPTGIASGEAFGTTTVFAAFTEIDTVRTNQAVPVGCSGLWLTIYAPGGGSGAGADGAFGTRPGGGGGGGGSVIQRSFIPVTSLGSTYSVVLGARGATGTRVAAGDGNPGGDGGNSSFVSGSVSIIAGGGLGGGGGLRNGTVGAGGAGGTVSISGATGISSVNGTAGANGNDGGTTIQNAVNNTAGGSAGGGGGGGRNSGGAGRAGGNGGNSVSQTGASGAAAGANNGSTPATASPGAGGSGAGGVGGGGTAGTGGAGGDYGGGAGGGGGGDSAGPGNQGGVQRTILEWV